MTSEELARLEREMEEAWRAGPHWDGECPGDIVMRVLAARRALVAQGYRCVWIGTQTQHALDEFRAYHEDGTRRISEVQGKALAVAFYLENDTRKVPA